MIEMQNVVREEGAGLMEVHARDNGVKHAGMRDPD
jgi:hypothetical protein